MSNTTFSFAFITDPQIGMKSPNGLEGPGSDKERLMKAIDYVNSNDIDLALFAGDHINRADSQEELDVFLRCVEKFEVPYYGVAGNHDLHADPTVESIYAKRGAPDGFSFVHKRAFFHGLNASRLRGDWGAETQAQAWTELESAFQQIEEECTKRFVVMHWPLFACHPDEEESYWNMPNRREIVDFFKDNSVTCVLSGHYHQDIDSEWNGVRFVSGIGTSRPIQYPEETSFKVVTVFDGGWSVRRVSVEDH